MPSHIKSATISTVKTVLKEERSIFFVVINLSRTPINRSIIRGSVGKLILIVLKIGLNVVFKIYIMIQT